MMNKYFLNYFSYNQCIQLDYKYTHAWNGKGVILDHLGKYEDALQAFW